MGAVGSSLRCCCSNRDLDKFPDDAPQGMLKFRDDDSWVVGASPSTTAQTDTDASGEDSTKTPAAAMQRPTTEPPLFDKIDTNHDGVITPSEWRQAEHELVVPKVVLTAPPAPSPPAKAQAPTQFARGLEVPKTMSPSSSVVAEPIGSSLSLSSPRIDLPTEPVNVQRAERTGSWGSGWWSGGWSANKFKDGDLVEYYSSTQQKWIPGKILAVYAEEKTYDIQVGNGVRPRLEESKIRTWAAPTQSTFKVNDVVEYHNAQSGQNVWVRGSVLNVHPGTRTCDIQIGTGIRYGVDENVMRLATS